MSDDIDIEEHDVLDNPRIKNIFPDLATIKTEVEDYEEIPDGEDHNNPYHSSFPFIFEEDDDLGAFQNKIIIGTKPSTSQTGNVFQNKIVVGSKTYSAQSLEGSEDEVYDVNDLPEVSVALEDWRPFLENSPCYCRTCEILFATETALDSHKMSAHSFLVAVGRNKAVKSTTKGSIISRIKFESDRQDLLCNHCNEVFPSEIALIKHTYELLPGNYESDASDPEFEKKVDKVRKRSRSSKLFYLCPICSCHFRWFAKLTTHMRSCHHTKDVGNNKPVRTKFECGFCGHRVKDGKHYNAHIQFAHPQLYNKSPSDDRTPKFKCSQCNLSFSSDYSIRIHRAAQHGYVDEVKTQSANEDGLSETFAPQKTESQTLVVSKPTLIPKSTLYKCSKCQIHFISCVTAVQHSRYCQMKRGEWKCQKCKRLFKLFDRVYHNYQHGIVEKFKVIEIEANMLNRILCRCRKCMACCDEKSLVSYHSESCSGDSPSVKCAECSVWIHSFALSAHEKIHDQGLMLGDFIFVDYVHIGVRNVPELAQATGSAEPDSAKPLYKAYFYCPTCKCFMQRNRHVDMHYIGKCNKNAKKFTCKHCGLRFTAKGLVSHKMRQKKFPNMKLKDLKFANIQNDMCIDPPFPDFKKCKLCNVRFFSDVALNNHVCNSEEPKVCIYCKEKFSDLAFNLHVPFHEYGNKTQGAISENIPEIMKKYESLKQVWNIIFLCETCDIVIDTYDKVVEHCQDHFCKMESYNVTIDHCEICDLKFVDECYRRHEEMHLNDDINRNSFKILKYKYDTLMSDAWLDVFSSLTKEQVDLVLSKSIYKFTRSVRMEVIIDGQPDLTLYKCGVCELIVPANKVAEHAQNKCTNLTKYKCSICSLLFVAKVHKIAHEKLHETRRIDENSFRIVQFVAEKQFDFKDPEAKATPDDLKFIRCQHCGKLINKQKYKAHIQYHKYYIKVKARIKVSAKHKAKTEQKGVVHKFYKCRSCNTCVGKQHIKEHICGSHQRKRCSKCYLFFKKQSLPSHYKYHEKYNMSRKNMNVTYFVNKKKRKAAVNSESIKLGKVTLYQCVDCRVCINKFWSVKRHSCPSSIYRVTCKLCGLLIHSSYSYYHKRLHELKQFTVTDVCVIKFKDGEIIEPSEHNHAILEHKRPSSSVLEQPAAKRPKVKDENEARVNYELSSKEYLKYISVRYYSCSTCKLLFLTCSALLAHETSCRDDRKGVKCDDCGLVLHHSMIQPHRNLQKCKLNISNTIFLISIQSRGKFVQGDSWIYLCRQCDVYTMTFMGAMYHLKNGHKHLSQVRRCDRCDIQLSRQSHSLHLKTHHRSREVTLSDISIATVEDTSFRKLRHDSLDDNVELESDSNVAKKSVPKKPLTTGIFRCRVCGLNFVTKGSLRTHRYYGKHDEKQYSCPECGLSFTNPTLKRHIEMHHSNRDVGNEDDSEKAVKDNSIIEIPRVSDETEPRPVIQNPTSGQIKCKLFKCSLCDVYFLTADACYEHTADHTALDPTEYIACKMCDLQFPCEFLGQHMRGHRDRTFCMDNLSIAEYQPGNKGQIQVDTYLAVDRLKSKLVTTTTHFDGEDDKTDSDVNYVDSTTENIPDSH